MVLAVTTTAEEGKDTENHKNCQTTEEESRLEEEKRKNDAISLGREEELKQQEQDTDKHLENDESINQLKGKLPEFEKQQENGDNIEKQQENGDNIEKQQEYGDNIEKQQEYGENIEKQQEIGDDIEKQQENGDDMKLETKDEVQQLQKEEETKLQHIDTVKDLEVDVKQTQVAAQVPETQQDVTGSNYEDTKEKKHTDQDNSPIKQTKHSSSTAEHSDQQAAQNSGLEIHQQNQREGQLSGGYRVIETAHVQEHPAKTKDELFHPFNHHEVHGDHNLHPTPNTYAATALNQHRDVHTHTLNYKGSVSEHFPVYIAEEKHLPYPVQKFVPYHLKQHTSLPVPVPVPYTIHKPVPYPVKIPVDRPYFVHVPVEKKVPFAVHVQVPVPQPYTVHVPKPYTVVVEKKVPAPYPVRIEVPVSQPYPVEIKIPVAVPVDRPVPVPVKVPVDKPFPVPVEKPYPVTVQKEVYYPVQKKVPYPIKVCIFD